ncbi:TrkH family potassium uptake protein [Butyrivibrio sp. MC2013]|uniref:TrkH family potassium uptake protein n=1 Tax=Butyrivibrio sp. MC2013 TaxID=1280686 RepID=UPI00040EDF16|nr:potassium transporter TrkG [Butyrivibrio sp. MC2013]
MFKTDKIKGIRLTPVQVIPASFLITIIIGALLLMLPFSSRTGEVTPFVTALFTATTSVCVTGLVVVDTYLHWSFIGQVIILILAQIGGLGMIAIAASLMVLTGRKFSLSDRLLLQDAFNLNTSSRLLSFLGRVLKGTLLVEAIGAILYAIRFVPQYGIPKGIWCAIFNSVSAFCNAGMDVLGPNSLADYKDDPLVLSVTMILIIMGGIGFVVWFDLMEKVKEGLRKSFTPSVIWGRLSEHSRLVISFTLALIIGGAIYFMITEYHNPATIGAMPFGSKLLNSLFESVTLRTAGFATFPQEGLNFASCLIAYIMMIIGGSPVGTAGGIKTVTFFLLLMNVRSYVSHRDENVIFKRSVSEESMRKAAAVAVVSLGAVMLMSILLLLVNPVAMEDALFEVVSACGTVGLTRGLTGSLNIYGRIVIIISMFLGRIGPISLVAIFSRNRSDANRIKYSEGTFYVG